ncbi:predicted protein [Chaetoceros tenuissimus]|uniref:Uncharacterized protein n=1 Tax=Chaetoceros tenuissimus TaxID=426638 RepID=A0AAD3HF59_9STRA|nr:predicted protein [Chaetoceros tenuissimus]
MITSEEPMNRSIQHNSIKKYCHDEEEIRMQFIVAIHKKRFGRKTSDLAPEEVNNDEEIGFMKSMVEIQTLCNNLEQDCTILIRENCSYNQTLCTAFVFAMLLAIVSAFGSTLEHQHHQEAFETKRGLLRKQQSPQPKYNQRTLQMDQHEFILKDEYLKLQDLNRNVWEVENEKRELQRKQQTLKDELLHLRQVEEDSVGAAVVFQFMKEIAVGIFSSSFL